MVPKDQDVDENVVIREAVGKTIQHMRVYRESGQCHEVSLWFTDDTELTIEIESRTQINVKHLSRAENDPEGITARMDILKVSAQE